MRDKKLYLIHILECIGDIDEYAGGNRERLLTSKLAQDATLRKLQVMAQSILRLPKSWKDAHPEVNWRAIRGFRSVIVHDYFEVDIDQVWHIVADDLPPLRRAVEDMLSALDAPSHPPIPAD